MRRMAGPVQGILVAATVALAAAGVRAEYPERPITLIVPWGAGGGTDAVARTFAAGLEQAIDVPVNVVNRAGGSGVVGHAAIANAEPDGYTLGMGTMEITIFDALGLAEITPASFTPILRVAAIPAGITVRADAPWDSAEELEQAIRDEPPGTFLASGSGQGGAWHLAVAGWLDAAGLEPDRVKWVPSQGGAPALNDLAAGGITMFTGSPVEAQALIEAGQVKTLAVMAEARSPVFPDVPTLEEATGAAWSASTWFALLGPAGLDEAQVAKLAELGAGVMESEMFQDFVDRRGYEPAGETGEAFEAFLAAEADKLGRIIEKLGLGS